MSWYPPPSSPGPITWLSDYPEATINLRGIYLNGPLQRVSRIFMEILRLKCFKYGSNMVCDISFKDCWGVQGSLEQNWSHFASHWLIRTAPSKHSPSVFVVGLQLVEWEKWTIPSTPRTSTSYRGTHFRKPWGETANPVDTMKWSNQDRGVLRFGWLWCIHLSFLERWCRCQVASAHVLERSICVQRPGGETPWRDQNSP